MECSVTPIVINSLESPPVEVTLLGKAAENRQPAITANANHRCQAQLMA